jgi:prevent-host-death family protein
MQTIADSYAVEHFTAVLDAIEQGEEVTITRKGKPMARIVPVRSADMAEGEAEKVAKFEKQSADLERERIRTAAEELRALGGQLRLNGLTIRDLIDEGRR